MVFIVNVTQYAVTWAEETLIEELIRLICSYVCD